MIHAALLLSALTASAPLTLAQAQAEARAHAFELKAAQSRAEGARGVAGASGRYFQDAPELSVSDAPGGLAGEPGENDFEIGLSQRLRLFGDWAAEGDAAQAARAEADARLEDAARALDEHVAVAFAAVQFAQENLRYLSRTEELFAIAADASRREMNVGSGNQLDVDASDLDLASARAEVAQAEGELASARAELALLLGQAPDALAVEAPSTSFELPAAPELDQLVEADPRVRGADRQLDGARSALTAVQRSRWPALTVGASYAQKTYVIPAGSFSGGAPDLSARWTDSELVLHLSLPVPLVNTQARPESQARAELLLAEAASAQVRAELRSELSARWSQLRAASAAAKALEATPAILERDFTFLEKAVRAGVLDAVARAQQLRRLNEAAVRWDLARRQLAEARAHWLRDVSAR